MVLFIALLGGACAWLAFGRPAHLDRAAHQLRRDGRPDGSVVDPPTAHVSIIVPARNEATTIPTLLESIARSTTAPAEVLVVDDSSTDATAEVAARTEGVTLIAAPPPPDGWVGKSWACHLGAERATAPLLLFLDADVRLASRALAALCADYAAMGSGLLSVQPSHRPVRWYEQLSAVFNIVGPMGSGAFARRRPRSQRVAFGPCLLTAATDYASAGGHEAVRHEVIEDIALAGRFDDVGLPVRVLLGGELIDFRMYPGGLRSLVDGWTKNIAAGALRTHRSASLLAALWVAALTWVATAAVLAGVSWARYGTLPWVELVAWCLAALQVHVLLRRVGRFHLLTSLLFAIPLAFFVVVFIRSVGKLLFGRPVRWRGRDVPSRTSGLDLG